MNLSSKTYENTIVDDKQNKRKLLYSVNCDKKQVTLFTGTKMLKFQALFTILTYATKQVHMDSS